MTPGRCHFNVVEDRRRRTARGVRGGGTSGGGRPALVRGGAIDDGQPLSEDGRSDGTQGHLHLAWGTVLQIVTVALLLSGLYLASTDRLKVCDRASRSDQCATFSFTENPSAHHKTTASWVLHVVDQWKGWGAGVGATATSMEVRDAYLVGCTTKLVDRHPLTAWEQATLRAQACYEAECRRRGKRRGTTDRRTEGDREMTSGFWDVQQGQQPADNEGEGTIKGGTCGTLSGHVTIDRAAPLKRQRAGEVTGVAHQQEAQEEVTLPQWSNQREALTILSREAPAFLSVAEVVRLVGTPLTMLIGTMKHMAKRAVPVKAWATEIEAIAATTITNVLEASWKWDGRGEPPQWGQESDRFAQLWPTYQAWHTLAYRPQVLAQMASLPPEHRVFTDLGERVRASMRIGWPPASYGPVPNAPRPRMEANKVGSIRRWYLHALSEAALYGAPHDGRLHKALRQELQGVFDPDQVVLWIETEWPSEGCMESVRIHTGGATGQEVKVWLRQQQVSREWSVIAVQGPLGALGRFSEYAVLPGAAACKRCGESHVNACRSRFLPKCFRWTDTVRHQKGRHGEPMWMRCESVECRQLPAGELCVCGRKSKLVPDFGSGIAVKSFDVTRVMEHRRNWFTRVPNIDAMCRHILLGGAYIPTVPGGIQPQIRTNLGSVGYDRPLLYRLISKYLISGALEYCHTIASRPHNILPLGLVVKHDLDEPWRAICDGRPTNPQLLPWKNRFWGLKACSPFFTPGAFCFSKDFSSAYHNCLLGTPCGQKCLGCWVCNDPHTRGSRPCAFTGSGLQQPLGHRRPMPSSTTLGLDWIDRGDTPPVDGTELHHERLKQVLSEKRRGPQRARASWDIQLTREEGQQLGLESVGIDTYIQVDNRYFTPAPDRGEVQWVQRKFLGCTPDTCARVGCQKCMFGIVMDDEDGVLHYFRFSVAHFGIRTAGNLFHALVTPLVRKYRRKGVRLIIWVDDVLIIVPTTCTRPFQCGGASQCAACQECKDKATALDAEFSEDLRQLGFETNKKGFRASQSLKFLGIVFDTCSMTFRVEREAAELFHKRCVAMLQGATVTPRELAKIVGLLNWWSIAVAGAKLVSRSMQAQSAAVAAKEHWDAPSTLTEQATEELEFWRDNIVRVAELGMPIVIPRFEELQAVWERGATKTPHYGPTCRLCHDGGPAHWGATLSRGPGTSDLEASGEYPAHLVSEGLCDNQPWREAIAGLMALKAFAPHIRGSVVLHYSDCACVVRALREGTATSTDIQRWAFQIWKFCSEHGIILISGWVPGEEVIRLGADSLSREAGVDRHGYTMGSQMQMAVRALCAKQGWRLTVDLFATAANAQCARFYSRYHDVGCEGADAFTIPSWRSSVCGCGSVHEDILLVFPPTKLLMPALQKLELEGCKGCIVVPKQPSMPFWSILEGGMIEEGVEVPGSDLQWPVGVSLRPEADNMYYVAMFDFSTANAPLNVQPPCEQVDRPRNQAPLTPDQQRALEMSIARQQLRWSLAEATARADLEELEQ